VHGAGSLDEISLSGETQIAESFNAACGDSSLRLKTLAFRAPRSKPSAAATPQENAKLIHSCSLVNRGRGSTLSSQTPPPRWWSREIAQDFRSAAELARQAVTSASRENSNTKRFLPPARIPK